MGCTSSKFAAEAPPYEVPLSGPRSLRKPPLMTDTLSGAPQLTFRQRPRISVFGTAHSPTIVIHPPSSFGGSDISPSPRTSMPPTPSALRPNRLASRPPWIGASLPSASIPMQSFPHIISSILDHASPAALHAFRAASKQCMAEADARLFHHIIFDDSSVERQTALEDTTEPLDWPGPTPLSRLVIRAPHGRLPCCPWANAGESERAQIAARLKHARVLDYHCDFDAAVDPVLAGAFSGVQVIRRIWPSSTVLPAPTVIDYVNLSVAGYWTASAQGPDRLAAPTIHPLPTGVKRAVINVIYPTRLGDFLPHFELGELHGADIVFKFTPQNGNSHPETQISRSPTYSSSKQASLAVMLTRPKPFGFMGGMLTCLAGHLETSSVTFVGLDDVPPLLLGIPPTVPADQLACWIAMGTTMCHRMDFDQHTWAYADQATSMAAWRTLHRMRFLRTWRYAVEQETQLGLAAASTRLELEDVPPTHGGDAAALWVPSYPHGCPPALIPVDPGPSPEWFQAETVRAVQQWRVGFESRYFGNGYWGEPC